MTLSLHEIIRRHAAPLAALPTNEDARLELLPGIRAVLFDVYGTMLISASGDVGTAAALGRAEAAAAALLACGLRYEGDPQRIVEALLAAIADRHEQLKAQGTEYPEIDIRGMWWQTLAELAIAAPAEESFYEQLAVEYEMRVNPVWPMPGVEALLAQLRGGDITLGIVSNAQFFTTPVLAELLGDSPARLGFPENLQFYSYRYETAKPGIFLYELAREALARKGVEPQATIYVGNDMLNDMAPAAEVGFRTALFAGDARSLRRREGDARVAGRRPDVVLTSLDQLAECVFP